MRPVEHLALEPDDARFGRGGERRDHPLRMGDRGGIRREDAVDRLDLARMNRRLPGEADALGGARLALEAIAVAEIGENRVDRLDPAAAAAKRQSERASSKGGG